MPSRSYTNPLTGETVTMNGKSFNLIPDKYNYNNLFEDSIDLEDIQNSIEFFLQNGYDGSEEAQTDLKNYLSARGANLSDAEFNKVVSDTNVWLNKNNINLSDLNKYYESGGTYSNPDPDLLAKEPTTSDTKEDIYNAYYNDLYSLEDGTFGRAMLDNYTLAEQNAAISNMQLAEAQYQQSAMQQAETVKAITDSVKAERMSRLRAGMSESQIANQDMQVMLNNMNTLNQQAAVMNQNRLAAQQQYNLAQDTAYQQYINSLTGLGGTSAAMAASDAGDAHMQTLKRKYMTGENYKQAHKKVTGQNS